MNKVIINKNNFDKSLNEYQNKVNVQLILEISDEEMIMSLMNSHSFKQCNFHEVRFLSKVKTESISQFFDKYPKINNVKFDNVNSYEDSFFSALKLNKNIKKISINQQINEISPKLRKKIIENMPENLITFKTKEKQYSMVSYFPVPLAIMSSMMALVEMNQFSSKKKNHDYKNSKDFILFMFLCSFLCLCSYVYFKLDKNYFFDNGVRQDIDNIKNKVTIYNEHMNSNLFHKVRHMIFELSHKNRFFCDDWRKRKFVIENHAIILEYLDSESVRSNFTGLIDELSEPFSHFKNVEENIYKILEQAPSISR